MKVEFAALISAIRKFLEELDDPQIKSFLADWPPANFRMRSVVPQTLPVLSWMSEALAAAGKKADYIVNMLASLANHLTWGQTYSAGDFGAGFLEKYGWTELIGLRGPIANDRMACGFLFLGPDIEYPQHSHEAEEVYLPLSGPTLWMRGNADWESRAPCRPIYHGSRLPHAMRTESVPLLALYLWRGGNLVEKSRIE
ncbi:MAG: transcriptional regulator [Desulfobacterales bacterium]|nr:transcriptional regulator [Desulfobacterales bacterium]